MTADKKTKTTHWRDYVWPKMGISRYLRYLGARLRRMKATPHAIAAGFASGAASSFTPFLGLHFLLGFAIAFATRGSMIAAALGTVVGNPLTFPLFFMLNLAIGRRIVEAFGGSALDVAEDIGADALMQEVEAGLSDHAFVTIAIGSVPSAILAWFVFYGLVRFVLARRRARIRAREVQANPSP